ncbi:MAG TPA: hypothetical protein VMP12_10955 [Candidatus Sulfotelmatobacter sp.]|nr:hypothetical protein [Candidatus Sulfotelmatobacter sp.]
MPARLPLASAIVVTLRFPIAVLSVATDRSGIVRALGGRSD